MKSEIEGDVFEFQVWLSQSIRRAWILAFAVAVPGAFLLTVWFPHSPQALLVVAVIGVAIGAARDLVGHMNERRRENLSQIIAAVQQAVFEANRLIDERKVAQTEKTERLVRLQRSLAEEVTRTLHPRVPEELRREAPSSDVGSTPAFTALPPGSLFQVGPTFEQLLAIRLRLATLVGAEEARETSDPIVKFLVNADFPPATSLEARELDLICNLLTLVEQKYLAKTPVSHIREAMEDLYPRHGPTEFTRSFLRRRYQRAFQQEYRIEIQLMQEVVFEMQQLAKKMNIPIDLFLEYIDRSAEMLREPHKETEESP